MLPLTLSMLLAAGPPSLASPGLSSPNLPAAKVTFFSDHLAQELSKLGLKVVTASEIASVLGYERQRQLLGCADDATSCFAELANALGADGIITGAIGKLGKRFHVTVKIISASTAKQLAFFDDDASSENDVLDLLTRAAPGLAEQVRASLAPPPSPTPEVAAPATATEPSEAVASIEPPAPSAPRLTQKLALPLILGGAGVAVAGGVVGGLGWARYAALANHDTATVGSDPEAFARTGATLQTVGIALLGTGAAVGVVGAVFLLLGSSNAPAVAVAPIDHGLALSFSTSFP